MVVTAVGCIVTCSQMQLAKRHLWLAGMALFNSYELRAHVACSQDSTATQKKADSHPVPNVQFSKEDAVTEIAPVLVTKAANTKTDRTARNCKTKQRHDCHDNQ